MNENPSEKIYLLIVSLFVITRAKILFLKYFLIISLKRFKSTLRYAWNWIRYRKDDLNFIVSYAMLMVKIEKETDIIVESYIISLKESIRSTLRFFNIDEELIQIEDIIKEE